MAQVDFKVTVWERVTIDDDKLDDVIARIKDGTITSSNDLFDCLDDDCIYEGTIDDTMEQMLPIENENQSTIEVLNGEGETIFTNGLFDK
jgi:hypothetical protein